MRSFVRYFTILAAVAGVPIGALAAQAAPLPVAVGARVRVRPHPLLPPIGVPRSAVQRLHVSRGASRWRSAFSGAVEGAALGVLWGHAVYTVNLRSRSFDTGAHARSRGSIIGAATLGVTQFIFPRERWRRVR